MGLKAGIVGLPNVGKSTFFNRLTETRSAIVDSVSGVTRDRQYGKSEWTGVRFSVIDTGGYVVGGDDSFEIEIRKQVQLAIEEADVILFLVDVKEGLTPMDEDVAEMLRKCKKKVLLVVNKGAELKSVPEVRTMTLEKATRFIEHAGFVVGEVSKKYDRKRNLGI